MLYSNAYVANMFMSIVTVNVVFMHTCMCIVYIQN